VSALDIMDFYILSVQKRNKIKSLAECVLYTASVP